MGLPLFIVDAFTDRPFRGNPAAVCLLDGLRPTTWLQDVAREMNLSETAFIHSEGDEYHLRWFTPTVEVDLCGHATLAGAHLLWEQGIIPGDREVRFLSKSGVLTAVQKGEWIELDFPAQPCKPLSALFSLDELLGVPASLVGASRLDYLVEVADEETLRGLQPDLAGLARLSCRGMIVTSRSTKREYDFVSRFFAPGAGIPEDPVTGSAHCCLGPYWGARLGKTVMVGYQASARGGVVRVELAGDRVKLGGKAVTVVRGELG
ncbi:MAG TPA: PhzF family phenazine biosynthesis protein [Geobacteraceae bacterium]